MTLRVAMRMAELDGTGFRKMLNRMNGEELRQVMLYFKLGVIRFAKEKSRRSSARAGSEVVSSMTDEELSTLALFFYLGVITFYAPQDATLKTLRASGIDLLGEIRKELGT